MALNQHNHTKETCFYHPSKEPEPLIQCHKCKRFVCQNDLKILTEKNLQAKYCPICYTKEEKLKLYILSIHLFFPVGFILGPLLSIAGAEEIILSFVGQNYFILLLFSFFEPIFILITVIMILAPFKIHRNISQLEYKTFLFLKPVTIDNNPSISKCQSKLSRKFSTKKPNIVNMKIN